MMNFEVFESRSAIWRIWLGTSSTRRFLDKTLFQYARRLHKFLPDDSSLRVLCKKLAGRETEFQPLTVAGRRWAACPQTPVLGGPVEFLMELESVGKGQNADTAVLAQIPAVLPLPAAWLCKDWACADKNRSST